MFRTQHLVLAFAFVVLSMSQVIGQTVYFSEDFESGGRPEWSLSPCPLRINETRWGGRHYQGPYGCMGEGCRDGWNMTCLWLSSLPAHTKVRVSFDLYVMGSWDGNGPNYGGEMFEFQLPGDPPNIQSLHTNFSNTENHQAYPGGCPPPCIPIPPDSCTGDPCDDYPPRTGATENNTLGYEFTGGDGVYHESMDSVYHFTFEVPHTSSRVQLHFGSEYLQPFPDE